MKRIFFPTVISILPCSSMRTGRRSPSIFPDLGVATSGTSEDDALLSARELLGCVMCGLEEDGEPIPAPSALSDIHPKDNERVVLVDAYMPSVRLASVNRSVNRTVTLPGVAQCRSP